MEEAGSCSFMAPEILLDEKSGLSSDVWSLGVIAFCMAKKQSRFSGNTQYKISESILNDSPPEIGSPFSKSFQHLISSMLTKDQYLRPKVKQIISHPLFERFQTISNSPQSPLPIEAPNHYSSQQQPNINPSNQYSPHHQMLIHQINILNNNNHLYLLLKIKSMNRKFILQTTFLSIPNQTSVIEMKITLNHKINKIL
jgi:serine/threonine protein kinase